MTHPNARLTPLARREVVDEVNRGIPQAEVARRFRVSRATVAKWVRRFRELGEAGLADRSCAPHRSPLRTRPELERTICSVRRTRPSDRTASPGRSASSAPPPTPCSAATA